MRGEETCRGAYVHPGLYRFRLPRCEPLLQLIIQLDDPAATVRGAIGNGEGVGGGPQVLLRRSVDPYCGFRRKGACQTDGPAVRIDPRHPGWSRLCFRAASARDLDSGP